MKKTIYRYSFNEWLLRDGDPLNKAYEEGNFEDLMKNFKSSILVMKRKTYENPDKTKASSIMIWDVNNVCVLYNADYNELCLEELRNLECISLDVSLIGLEDKVNKVEEEINKHIHLLKK